MKILADELLIHAIDMHCHCYPEFSLESMKRMEDLEWMTTAARMGMRGAVLKSHFWPTMTNVYYVRNQVPEGFKVFSSITLNVNCGGLVAYAVEAAANLGAKVVWMPTWSSKNNRKLKWGMSEMIKKLVPSIEHYEFEGLSVLDAQGRVIREAKEIIEVSKDRDLVLFTGHLSAAEGLELARQAKDIGYKKMVFGHPDSHSIKASVEQMKEFAEAGGYVEFTFIGTLPLLQDKHPRDMVKLVKEVGAERCILSTDSFFDWVPPAPEILRMAIASFLELGVTKEEIRMMVQRNPAVLLGLEG